MSFSAIAMRCRNAFQTNLTDVKRCSFISSSCTFVIHVHVYAGKATHSFLVLYSVTFCHNFSSAKHYSILFLLTQWNSNRTWTLQVLLMTWHSQKTPT